MFWFKTQTTFGLDNDKRIEGAIVTSDPSNNSNGIFLLPSSRLEEPTEPTMQILKAAKTIITDNRIDFDKFMRTLKAKILQDVDRWRQCSQTLFIVLRSADDLKKIEQILADAKQVKNVDTEDRGHFLGSVLKHIDESVWEKVDKDVYIQKYIQIDAELSIEEVKTVCAPRLLAELIESKFAEEESFMKQILIGEQFEQIRAGVFLAVGEEEKASEENLDVQLELTKKMSTQLMAEVEESKDLPNFTAILTKTDKFSNNVAETIYETNAPEKPNHDTYAEHFRNTIFSDNGLEPKSISGTYHTCVRTLRQNYSRAILLNILSTASESLDEESKVLVSKKSTFSKLCDTMHIDYMTAR